MTSTGLTHLHSPPGNTVPCRDVGRRRREVLVTPLSGGRVMITTPPGEVAVFDPEDAEELRRMLHPGATDVPAAPAPAAQIYRSLPSTVACADTIGRERAVTITPRPGGRIVLAAPPGGVAIFRPLNVEPLRAALREAIAVARIRTVTE